MNLLQNVCSLFWKPGLLLTMSLLTIGSTCCGEEGEDTYYYLSDEDKAFLPEYGSGDVMRFRHDGGALTLFQVNNGPGSRHDLLYFDECNDWDYQEIRSVSVRSPFPGVGFTCQVSTYGFDRVQGPSEFWVVFEPKVSYRFPLVDSAVPGYSPWALLDTITVGGNLYEDVYQILPGQGSWDSLSTLWYQPGKGVLKFRLPDGQTYELEE